MSISTFHKGHQKAGFSIIEGIIALALLMVISISTYTFYDNLSGSSKRIARNNICEIHNKKIFSKIVSRKLDATITQDFLKAEIPSGLFIASNPTNILMKAPAAAKARLDSFPATGGQLYKKRPAETVGTLNIKNNGTLSFMPLLSNNYMGYLADLYRAGFTQNAGLKPLPPELKPEFEDSTNSASMTNLNQRYKSSTQMILSLYQITDKSAVADQTDFFPMPSSQYPEKYNVSDIDGNGERVTKFFPYSLNKVVIAQFPPWIREDLGIKVILKSQIKDFSTNDLIQECETSVYYEYPMKIQNTVDFGDFEAIRYRDNVSGPLFTFDPLKLKQDTQKSSSKNSLTSSASPITDSHELAPIFTNFNAAFPDLGRDRNLCSQKGQAIDNFYVKFRIKNLSKEPGAIPVCIDNSTQWLAAEAATGGWCPLGGRTYATESHVKINYDWKPGDLGWVPCETLKFCGQQPDWVDVNQVGDSYEYRFGYKIKADDNSSGNRLWGCEVKYMAATVDIAGNLSYPPSTRPDFTGAAVADKNNLITKLNPETIAEINPKIYFKPPPCYMCSCKQCKKGKGGFFGSLFKLFVLIVLVVATGGSALFALPTLATGLGFLAVLCGVGNLGCDSSTGTAGALTSPTGSQFTSCADNNITHCSCGSTCNKVRVPGPRWIDTVQNLNEIQLANNQNSLLSRSCPMEIVNTVLGPENTNVQMTFTYKVKMTTAQLAALPLIQRALYSPVTNSPDYYYMTGEIDELGVTQTKVVQYLDEVVWQQFDSAAGVFCTSRYFCNGTKMVPSKQTYSYADASGNLHNSNGAVAVEGCFKVKTGHTIDWGNNSADPQQLKPNPKVRNCLEVDFAPGVLNETGETLKRYADLSSECSSVANVNSATPEPIPDSNPLKRIVGSKTNGVCATPISYTNPAGQTSPVTLATPIGIGDGATCNNNNSGSTYQLVPKKLRKQSFIYRLLFPNSEASPFVPSDPCESFVCWTGCTTPINLPQGPPTGKEQLYYENYSSSLDKDLPFCTIDKSLFDTIN